jgi:hypothetical protein
MHDMNLNCFKLKYQEYLSVLNYESYGYRASTM